VDPARRTLGRFFHEEIARPLGIDFYIGLPPEIPDSRLARFKPLSVGRAIGALRNTPRLLIMKVLEPRSLLRRSLAIPAKVDFNQRRWLEVELPAGNGVGTARAIARAYAALAEGGGKLGIGRETLDRVLALPTVERPQDEVLGIPTYFSLGFARPGPDFGFGSSERAFGHPGAGGSFGFGDPDARVGYAYVMNKLNFWLFDDPREKALREAVYRAIRRAAG
jgi:CubicO group peptidase (beta-lactamase class C family)